MVEVPDSNNTMDLLDLYNSISNHTLDELEPFVPVVGDQCVRMQVGKLETGHCQDIPLTALVADAARTFGNRFQILCEDWPRRNWHN